jgi:hypothetical protein
MLRRYWNKERDERLVVFHTRVPIKVTGKSLLTSLFYLVPLVYVSVECSALKLALSRRNTSFEED